MFGTYVMYLDIAQDDDNDYDDGESSNEDYYNLQIPFCRHYETRKDSQKYRQRPCKNCENVHF